MNPGSNEAPFSSPARPPSFLVNLTSFSNCEKSAPARRIISPVLRPVIANRSRAVAYRSVLAAASANAALIAPATSRPTKATPARVPHLVTPSSAAPAFAPRGPIVDRVSTASRDACRTLDTAAPVSRAAPVRPPKTVIAPEAAGGISANWFTSAVAACTSGRKPLTDDSPAVIAIVSMLP